MKFQLRDYQRHAKDKVYEHLRHRDDNPCVVIPTGGGKTPVIASICKDAVEKWNGRVLILAHVKELLQQAAEKLQLICPEVRFGVYSAGLNSRQTSEPVIVASIQSAYQRAYELGAFDLILVDEAHLIPPEGEGRYRQFLADAKRVNPNVRVIGFTATPFRLRTGPICTPDGILSHVAFEVGVRELIVNGFLSPLITKAGQHKPDVSNLKTRAGEFVREDVEQLMNDDELVEAACAEIVEQTRDRESVLIFASGIEHAEHVVRVLGESQGEECGFVCGETPPEKRDEILRRFRERDLKFLCNVNVLTTGFDAPNIDAVVLLRPTLSAGLFYQMVGRGFRLWQGKRDCLVLDFGGNVLRHGPVDQLQVQSRTKKGKPSEAPAKECPECQRIVAAGYARCPGCGFEFPKSERSRHDDKATVAPILSEHRFTDTEYDVQDTTFFVHRKTGTTDDAPKTLRVDYRLGFHLWQSEFLCFEHKGYARQKAVAWWKARSPDPVPDTAAHAVQLAEAGALCLTEKITIRSTEGQMYGEIVDHKLGPRPEPCPLPDEPFDPSDIPF
ncbi:MAG: DEAD/DEAH box helicase family protein [Gemmataceae bacterium]